MSPVPPPVSPPGSPRPVTPTTILARSLDELVRRLDEFEDGPVDAAFRAQLQGARELAVGLDPYLSESATPESAALSRLARRTAEEDWNGHSLDGNLRQLEQEMLSGHVEGQALKMLVHATAARRVLEIGMFTGYSALAMAEALPADGRLVACEIDPEVAAFARRCFEESADGHKIVVEVGPAQATLAKLSAAGAPFDLVFIDADKDGYLGYLDTLLSGDLLSPRGLICVDNTLMQGQPWLTGSTSANGSAITEFNRAVADDSRVEQVILPLRDGLTLIRRVVAR